MCAVQHTITHGFVLRVEWLNVIVHLVVGQVTKGPSVGNRNRNVCSRGEVALF